MGEGRVTCILVGHAKARERLISFLEGLEGLALDELQYGNSMTQFKVTVHSKVALASMELMEMKIPTGAAARAVAKLKETEE